MKILEAPRRGESYRIAWQSALAASICLGLPAGLLFWLILLQRIMPSHPVERLVTFLQNNGVLEIIGMLFGAFGWGIILSQIRAIARGGGLLWQVCWASMLVDGCFGLFITGSIMIFPICPFMWVS